MAGNLVQGAVFTVMVVRAGMLRDPGFEAELAEQVQRSPRFFHNAPVVLDLKGTEEFAREAEFAEAKEILRRHTLTLIGIQNAAPIQAAAAAAAGLAGFAPNSTQPSRPRPAEAAPGPSQAPQSHASPSAAKSRLITQPVRSGTQIYARGGDLVIVAPVSAGAEVIADGHIHVYGTLRGRAIAGASGDISARIFCGNLDAELVSIAGFYCVNEAIDPAHLKQRMQISLAGEQLMFERLP
jgi:septum site-determining protein MinC